MNHNASTRGKDMPDRLARDVEPAIIEKLKKSAVRNGRSLQSEVRIIISDYANSRISSDADVARRIKKAFAGRKHSDSAELLREDRAK